MWIIRLVFQWIGIKQSKLQKQLNVIRRMTTGYFINKSRIKYNQLNAIIKENWCRFNEYSIEFES